MSETPTKPIDRSTLEGVIPALATPDDRNTAMDLAFDYRGDVTIETRAGKIIEGYVFDRRSDVAEPHVRLIPKDSDERVKIPYADIARLVFSGRDTAAGKSWETWLKKWSEKRAKGEAANLEAESLD